MNLDRDALLCDLAETYHIFDYRAVPVETLARLACGLGIDSRIQMKMRGAKVPFELMLNISILDNLKMLIWMQSRDGQKNRNRPKPILTALYGEEKQQISKFNTPEEFEQCRARIIKGA